MTLAYNLSQLANNVNSSGQLDAATGLTNTSSLGFPTGTLMLFQQSTAPTSWTKQTTHNNKALRVVSGTASSGGTSAFTTVFSNQTVTIGSTTLSTTQIPAHAHGYSLGTPNAYSGVATRAGNMGQAEYTGSTNNAGGGGSHTHSSSAITLDVAYVDLIICIKN